MQAYLSKEGALRRNFAFIFLIRFREIANQYGR